MNETLVLSVGGEKLAQAIAKGKALPGFEASHTISFDLDGGEPTESGVHVITLTGRRLPKERVDFNLRFVEIGEMLHLTSIWADIRVDDLDGNDAKAVFDRAMSNKEALVSWLREQPFAYTVNPKPTP